MNIVINSFILLISDVSVRRLLATVDKELKIEDQKFRDMFKNNLGDNSLFSA